MQRPAVAPDVDRGPGYQAAQLREAVLIARPDARRRVGLAGAGRRPGQRPLFGGQLTACLVDDFACSLGF